MLEKSDKLITPRVNLPNPTLILKEREGIFYLGILIT